jgi:C4-dicarboxylate-specific signal transduction histidine kinase
MTNRSDLHPAAVRASAWKQRTDRLQQRAYSARQREVAALGRSDGASVRDLAAQIRADAARVRDDGARTRDDAARVRDNAARVRDRAAMARDLSIRTRDEAVRRRMLVRMDQMEWAEVVQLDRLAAAQALEAMGHDRAAADLDRAAAEKDRDAAEHDRRAAEKDREAAEKDRDASEKDRVASDSDRSAAESDRAESENELSVAEGHLDKTNRLATLGRLAASIAHEVNNPLAALMSTLATLQLDLEQKQLTSETAAPMLADAQLAAERIASVMGDMKAWLYDGDERPATQRIDVAKWVNESVRLTRKKLDAKAVVVVDLQHTETIFGLPSRLGQVLTNLLVNAARAIEGPPEKNEIRITSSNNATGLRIEVKDSGCGIKAEVLPHIFDPFFTTHEGSGGMGLGLAMCERIVTDHGGALTVETVLGQGSTFRIELPNGAQVGGRDAKPALPS